MLVARVHWARRNMFFRVSARWHFSNLQRSLKRLNDKRIRISAHDLRRGFATVAEAVGFRLAVIKMLLNHAAVDRCHLGYIQTDGGQLLMATQMLPNAQGACQVADLSGKCAGSAAPCVDEIIKDCQNTLANPKS